MDSDLIKSILSVVGALIPLLIAIIAFYANLAEKTTGLIDNPSLKISKIKRYPINERLWKQISRRYRIFYYTLIISIVFYYGFFFLIFSFILGNTNILVVLSIFLAVFLLSSNLMKNSFKMVFANEHSARYFIFKDILIIIEADYHYLFNKCHETLKNMKFKVIEVDETLGTLEACQITSWKAFSILKDIIGSTSQIEIKIEQVEKSKSLYQVKINCTRIIDHEKKFQDFTFCSKLTNRFINLLISRPKGTDQKAESKIDISTDVGD